MELNREGMTIARFIALRTGAKVDGIVDSKF